MAKKIFNRGTRLEMNRRAYIKNVKKWIECEGFHFWGRVNPDNSKNYAHDYKELIHHGGGIWTLKNSRSCHHSADKVLKRMKKEASKARRREDRTASLPDAA